jgi:para-aminobenzoate synthetase/4-amino-4-deoxychorismate lyase
MHATRDGGCRHLQRHLQRLRTSAAYFGIAWDEPSALRVLRDSCSDLQPGMAYRMRLALNAAGAVTLRHAPLTPLPDVVKVLLAAQAPALDPLFLRHKTTIRACYDAAWQTAEQAGAFDALFCNAQGALTEGGRSSLFVQLEGRWYTPPLSAGVLPGVMRAVLLDDPQWHAAERSLTLEDLRRAEQVVVCNALRGALPAEIVWPDAD